MIATFPLAAQIVRIQFMVIVKNDCGAEVHMKDVMTIKVGAYF